MEPPKLDLPARSRLCREGRSRPGPLSGGLAREAADSRRFRHLDRREDKYSSSKAQARDLAYRARTDHASRARIRAVWGLGLSGRMGCATSEDLRGLCEENRHRSFR